MLRVSLVSNEGETERGNDRNKLHLNESQKHRLDKQAAPYKSSFQWYVLSSNSDIRLTSRSERVFLDRLTCWAAANV
jgi:hypothetical protein